jgi:pimeloyl-ACP methyl ester carboxylesterase
MPYAQSTGAKLYYEETGSGHPVIFVHEFADDHRSWDNQVRFFSGRYRCITFNARGYPPSDIPEADGDYGYEHAAGDIAAVLRHLDIEKAHIVGLSMGGFATLVFGLRYPAMASALVVTGCGAGSEPSYREAYLRNVAARAARFLDKGAGAIVEEAASDSSRVQLRRKDPKAWEDFIRRLGEHSGVGSSRSLRNFQGKRPPLTEFEPGLRALSIPTLVITGDEDEHCLQPALYLKSMIATAGLWMVPCTGHAVNLEEPATFNAVVQRFFDAAEARRWQGSGHASP